MLLQMTCKSEFVSLGSGKSKTGPCFLMPILLTILASAAAAVPAAEAPAAPGDAEIIVTGERTEGQDDYAVKKQTTTMRFPISQRETPQSVSVVTRAQIEDFQLNDINDLLKTVPGVQV